MLFHCSSDFIIRALEDESLIGPLPYYLSILILSCADDVCQFFVLHSILWLL